MGQGLLQIIEKILCGLGSEGLPESAVQLDPFWWGDPAPGGAKLCCPAPDQLQAHLLSSWHLNLLTWSSNKLLT